MQNELKQSLKAHFSEKIEKELPDFVLVANEDRKAENWLFRKQVGEGMAYWINLKPHGFYDGYTIELGVSQNDNWPGEPSQENMHPHDEFIDGGIRFRIDKLWEEKPEQEFWWWIGGDPRSNNIALDPLAMFAEKPSPQEDIENTVTEAFQKVLNLGIPYFQEACALK